MARCCFMLGAPAGQFKWSEGVLRGAPYERAGSTHPRPIERGIGAAAGGPEGGLVEETETGSNTEGGAVQLGGQDNATPRHTG
jgi:hypothetical protein